MTEQLPRTITFDEIRVGDEVSRTHCGVTYTGVVGAVRTGSVATVVGATIGWAESDWTLLSRPTPRGPAWDSSLGDVYKDPRNGELFVRAEGAAPNFDGPRFVFIGVSYGSHGFCPGGAQTARLVPFIPPPSELDTLRQNVIDAALGMGDATASSGTFWAAVRALRDHEAKS